MKEYEEGRIWFTQKGKIVTVGITERALQELGSVQSISLPTEGEDCMQDDVVAELEGDQSSFEMISPLEGMIVSVNDELSENPDVVQNDPLDEGWIFKMKLGKTEDEEEDEQEE